MCEKNKSYLAGLIEMSVKKNILPLTSRCNFACLFCSHAGNPRGVLSYRFPETDMDDVYSMVGQFNPGEKLVIGESATRLMEGEPLLHPFFFDILNYIRQEYPGMLFQLTTNGSMLDMDCVEQLSLLSPVEVNISINTVDPVLRKQVLGDCRNNAVNAPALLRKFSIPYHGSIVMLPEVTGWDDIEKTIACLDANGAITARLFLPGYSSYSRNKYNVDYSELLSRIDIWSEKYDIPMIHEPAGLTDLDCRISGIVRNSPAALSGLRRGDLITDINGLKPLCRKQAFTMALSARNPRILAVRGNEDESVDTVVIKGQEEPSGIVFHYDIDPSRFDRVLNKMRRSKCSNILIMTSKLAYGVICCYIEKHSGRLGKKQNITIISVENKYFGGSIACAGLLTVSDFLNAVQGEKLYDAVVIPAEPFDDNGVDMVGASVDIIEEKLGISVYVL